MRKAGRQIRQHEFQVATKGNLRRNRWRSAMLPRNKTLVVDGDRTKTDTGGWEEDSKARERTLVKELGKLSP